MVFGWELFRKKSKKSGGARTGRKRGCILPIFRDFPIGQEARRDGVSRFFDFFLMRHRSYIHRCTRVHPVQTGISTPKKLVIPECCERTGVYTSDVYTGVHRRTGESGCRLTLGRSRDRPKGRRPPAGRLQGADGGTLSVGVACGPWIATGREERVGRRLGRLIPVAGEILPERTAPSRTPRTAPAGQVILRHGRSWSGGIAALGTALQALSGHACATDCWNSAALKSTASATHARMGTPPPACLTAPGPRSARRSLPQASKTPWDGPPPGRAPPAERGRAPPRSYGWPRREEDGGSPPAGRTAPQS